mmetsp:Transcript_44195/g.73051  ORF Transcript_44195/g.73051 Transcript_44195/m.73051 type:complete len:204 (+) Transcript_44195:170-781(+)
MIEHGPAAQYIRIRPIRIHMCRDASTGASCACSIRDLAIEFCGRDCGGGGIARFRFRVNTAITLKRVLNVLNALMFADANVILRVAPLETIAESVASTTQIDTDRHRHEQPKHETRETGQDVIGKGEESRSRNRRNRKRNNETKTKRVAFGANVFAIAIIVEITVSRDWIENNTHNLAFLTLFIVRLADLDLIVPRRIRIRRI